MELKPLTAVFMQEVTSQTPVSIIANLMNALPRQPLQHNAWPEYTYKPEVHFSIGHNNTCILIKYFVREKVIKAVCNQPQLPVYKDSCVEFFIEPVPGEGYYNFEFNCIGTNLSGFGRSRNGRVALPVEDIRKIRYHVVIHNQTEDDTIGWELTVSIPSDLFSFHPAISLKGMRCAANFYKCGDELPEPHYLSWSPIQTATPDFHQPRYFGPLYFE